MWCNIIRKTVNKGETENIEFDKEKRRLDSDNLFKLTVLKRLPRIKSEFDELEEVEINEIMAEIKEEQQNSDDENGDDDFPF